MVEQIEPKLPEGQRKPPTQVVSDGIINTTAVLEGKVLGMVLWSLGCGGLHRIPGFGRVS